MSWPSSADKLQISALLGGQQEGKFVVVMSSMLLTLKQDLCVSRITLSSVPSALFFASLALITGCRNTGNS